MPDLAPSERLLFAHLETAARIFFDETDPDYDAPTTGNRFVILAESAYYAELKQRNALRTRPTPAAAPFYLYRLFDRSHRLLYVGITGNWQARLRRHRKHYGDTLDHWDLEPYEDHAAVLAAEALAIASEHPAFNVSHPS